MRQRSRQRSSGGVRSNAHLRALLAVLAIAVVAPPLATAGRIIIDPGPIFPGPGLPPCILPPVSSSVPALEAGSDSGKSATDGITNAPNPVVTGTLRRRVFGVVENVPVTLNVNSPAGQVPAITLTTNGSGVWRSNLPAHGEGNYLVNATVEGCTSPTATLTVDRTSPVLAAPILQTASDTGASQVDGLTRDTSPTFVGLTEGGATVTLLRDQGAGKADGPADGQGRWAVTDPGPIADGPHTYQAKATDLAGNNGPLSPAAGINVTTREPPPPTVFGPPEGSSTLVPKFDLQAGVGLGVAWTLTGPLKRSGISQFPNLDDIPAGMYTLTVVASDTAGNTSTPVVRHFSVQGNATIARASLGGKWKGNLLLRGRLRIAGTSPAAEPIRVRLTRSGKKVLESTITPQAAGGFAAELALPRRVLPGQYSVVMTGTGITTTTFAVRLAGPPSGLVDRAFVTTAPRGAARDRARDGVRVLYAVFHFAALPKKGRPLNVVWSVKSFHRAVPATRPAGNTVVSQIGSLGAGVLSPGVWKATIRSNGVALAVARIRVG